MHVRVYAYFTELCDCTYGYFCILNVVNGETIGVWFAVSVMAKSGGNPANKCVLLYTHIYPYKNHDLVRFGKSTQLHTYTAILLQGLASDCVYNTRSGFKTL